MSDIRVLVEMCAVCDERPTFVTETIYTPLGVNQPAPGTWEYVTPELVGWRTSCGCLVPASEWTVLITGPAATPRWVLTAELNAQLTERSAQTGQP